MIRIKSLSNIEFRFIRVGTELIKLNNKHTSHPVLLNLDIRKIGDSHQVNVSYTLRHFGGEPNEILGLLDFAKAMNVGGKLQITFLEAEKSFTSDIDGLPVTLNTFPDPALYELVQKLCFIQDKTGQFFQIPKDGILVKDADAISELFEIFKSGINYYANATANLGLMGKGLEMLLDVHKQGKPIHFKSIAQESFIELFGLDISLGPMIRDITGFIETDPIELEEIMKKLDTEEFLNITLVNANGTETFTDWYPSEIQELE